MIISIYKNFEEISKIFIIRRLDSLKPENIQENILKQKYYFTNTVSNRCNKMFKPIDLVIKWYSYIVFIDSNSTIWQGKKFPTFSLCVICHKYIIDCYV